MIEQPPFRGLEQKIRPPVQQPRRIVAFKTTVLTARDKFAKTCLRHTPKVASNLLFFGGLIAVTIGFWMFFHPLGPIIGGGLATWVGMLVSAEDNNEPRT